MSYAIVYISAALFALIIFPVHISDYMYADSREGYASLNVCVYRYIRLFNVNTVKNKPNHMMVNGKDKELEFKTIKANIFGIIKRLQILKIVQLGDYGLLSDGGAYIALAQRAASCAVYSTLVYNGSTSKLKNYTILDQSRLGVRYYSKAEIAINAVAILNIILYLISEKIK